MPNKIIKFLIVVLFLVTIVAATETTWRHSGFEVAQYDINFASIYNVTELRVLEWGWNASTPSVSDSDRAKMYYNNNNKRMMQSIDSGAYEAIVTNTTVNFYSGNASNLTGVLPNASIPLSAANLSVANTFTTTGTTSFVGSIDIGTATVGGQLDVNNTGGSTYVRILGDVDQQQALEFKDTAQRWVIYKPASSIDLRFHDGGTDRVTLQNGGNVGIGTTNPSYGLMVQKDSGPGWAALFRNSSIGEGVLLGTRSSVGVVQGVSSGGTASTLSINGDGGNVGIGNTSPLNILAFAEGSATDPIADSWLQYSTPESKIVLGEADNLTEKYRADFRNTTVYRWKRTANEPERLGVLAQNGIPSEILAYHDGRNNTNSTAVNATPQGIDLGAYIGWLHEIVKGQDIQLQAQEQKIASLEARVQKLENRDIVFANQINYLYANFNLTKP